MINIERNGEGSNTSLVVIPYTLRIRTGRTEQAVYTKI